MPILTSYPSVTPEGQDLVLLVDKSSGSNATKTATIDSIISLAGGAESAEALGRVGMVFTPGTSTNPLLTKTTTRTDGNFPTTLKYSRLQVSFENLTLDAGSTYKLIIERWKKGGNKGAKKQKSGFKRQDPKSVVGTVYADRPSEIAITATKDQIFDFRPDLYYSSASAGGFPRPAGFKVPKASRTSSVQYLAFRISKTTGTTTLVSPIIGKLKLIGDYSSQAAGEPPTITYSAY